MTDQSSFLRDVVGSQIVVPHSGDIVSWADGTLKIPYSVRYPIYMAAESPWLIEPMRAMSDQGIRRVDVRAPAGSAKSLIGEIHIAHCIAESPGLYYYVWQTDDDGKDAMEDRIYPMIEANAMLCDRLPVDRNKKRIAKVAFPHMSLYCVGANPSAAQSKRVKYLTMEEPHLYGAGMMTAFEKRVEGVRSHKILTLSTGSILGDESDESFNSGTCETWQVPCPTCGAFQTMTDSRERLLAQIDSETCDENGDYNWQKILPTVRYNCESCGADWPTDDAFRKEQSKSGKYVATNPNAASDHRSFHLEACSVHYFPLAKLLMEKLKAVAAYKRGAIEPFKDYMQKRRAMAWDEAPEITDEQAAFDRSKGDYKKRDPAPDEVCRFLTVDNQAGSAMEGAHRWFTCRSFAPDECRLIDEGKIQTWEEVEELRIALGVDPARTLIDIAFDSPDVQRQCIKYGWQGLRGDNTSKDSFPHHSRVQVGAAVQTVTRHLPFSKFNVGHTGIGTGQIKRAARYYFWCQQPIKNMWHRLKNGLTEYRWTVPQDVSDEYQKQTGVEFKKQQTTRDGKKKWEWLVRKGKANHLTDCDQMCLVAALMDPRIRAILWSDGDEKTTATDP